MTPSTRRQVSSTRTRDTLRVIFPAPGGEQDETKRIDVVCFVRPSVNGEIEIVYSHHLYWGRSAGQGPWSQVSHRFPLDPAVSTFIRHEVFLALWSAFGETMPISADLKGVL